MASLIPASAHRIASASSMVNRSVYSENYAHDSLLIAELTSPCYYIKTYINPSSLYTQISPVKQKSRVTCSWVTYMRSPCLCISLRAYVSLFVPIYPSLYLYIALCAYTSPSVPIHLPLCPYIALCAYALLSVPMYRSLCLYIALCA